MWLETLTLQTHQSRKKTIEAFCRDMTQDSEFASTNIRVFYHQNAVLHMTWHLQHLTIPETDCSIQATRLIELLRPFGSVHHRTWLPLSTLHLR